MLKALRKAAEKPRQQKISFDIGLNVFASEHAKTDPEISYDLNGASDDANEEHLPGNI